MSAAMAIVKELTEKHEKRIAELEAALAAFVEVAPRAIHDLNEEGYLRVCHELEAALEMAGAVSRKLTHVT